MAYLDARILAEIQKLTALAPDHTPVLMDVLNELRLLRLAVSESLDIDLAQVNVMDIDAVSTT